MAAAQPTETEVDLVVEYSPSFNSKRFQDGEKPNEYVLQNFVNVTKDETDRVRAKYDGNSNVRYGGDPQLYPDDNQLLDIFFKDKEYGKPIFAYIHGGFWQCLTKATSGSFVAPLVERNWCVVTVDYNLCPPNNLKKTCIEIGNFFRWLLEYANKIEASSIVVCGHSAGAYLVSQMLTDIAVGLLSGYRSCKISLILISGIYDLRQLVNLEAANPDNILELTGEIATQLSPICWNPGPTVLGLFREHNIQIHVIAADNDSRTFKNQSKSFAKKLTEFNLNVSFAILGNYDHFDIIEEAAIENSKVFKYIWDLIG